MSSPPLATRSIEAGSSSSAACTIKRAVTRGTVSSVSESACDASTTSPSTRWYIPTGAPSSLEPSSSTRMNCSEESRSVSHFETLSISNRRSTIWIASSRSPSTSSWARAWHSSARSACSASPAALTSASEAGVDWPDQARHRAWLYRNPKSSGLSAANNSYRFAASPQHPQPATAAGSSPPASCSE